MCVICITGAVTAVAADDTDDGFPRVTLTEMLDDLHIADDATGDSGAVMME